jgi:hypothetical protein
MLVRDHCGIEAQNLDLRIEKTFHGSPLQTQFLSFTTRTSACQNHRLLQVQHHHVRQVGSDAHPENIVTDAISRARLNLRKPGCNRKSLTSEVSYLRFLRGAMGVFMRITPGRAIEY